MAFASLLAAYEGKKMSIIALVIFGMVALFVLGFAIKVGLKVLHLAIVVACILFVLSLIQHFLKHI